MLQGHRQQIFSFDNSSAGNVNLRLYIAFETVLKKITVDNYMNIQYLVQDGIRIAYIEQNATAAHTLFFIHGNSVSKRIWHRQLSSPLLSAYRLVAIDLPAHGDSGIAAAGDYNLPQLARILAAVVQQLADGKPYLLAGISLSTNLVAEMLAHNVQSAGLLLAAPCIVGKNHTVAKMMKPGTRVGVVFADAPALTDVQQYASEAMLSADAADRQMFLEDYQNVTGPFRSSLAQSIADANYSDEISLLAAQPIPLLVIFGKDERVIDPDYLDDAPLPLWQNTIYKLDGASHLVNIDQPEAFNALLQQYAADRFR